MLRRALPAALLVLAFVAAAAAQQAKVAVHLDPQRFGVEDRAQLVVEVKGGDVSGAPVLEDLSNLRVVAGPSVGRQMSWINGVSSSSIRFTWVLEGLEVGAARVGSIRLQVDGEDVTTDPVVADVAPGRLRPTRAPSPFFQSPMQQILEERRSRDATVALRLILPKTTVYAGEPLVATIALETSGPVEGFDWVTGPAFPGWWSQPVERPDQVRPERVVDGSDVSLRYPVVRTVLIPLLPGSVEIPAARAQVGLRGAGFFSSPTVVTRSTETTTVTVVARPDPPAAYPGAVGTLRYRSKLEPESVAVGEVATLTVELSGRGNLPLVEAPSEWPSCAGCELYPPEESSEIEVDDNGIRGKRTWRVAVLPREPGRLKLDPVKLAVFDPEQATYRVDTIGGETLEAEGAPPETTPTPEPARQPAEPGATAPDPGGASSSGWLLAIVLVAGVALGVVIATVLLRRRTVAIPPASGSDPAERARALQAVLEGWWAELDERRKSPEIQSEADALRRELERVRFAPARADHTHTVDELESRLRKLLKRA